MTYRALHYCATITPLVKAHDATADEWHFADDTTTPEVEAIIYKLS